MENVLTQARAVLSTTPERWRRLVDALSLELLTAAPAPGEWSALDCLQHLLDTERQVFPARVRAFLAGEDFAAFDPDAEGATGSGAERRPAPAEIAATFARLRAESLALIASLRPADLSRTARHAELGMATLEEMLHEWAGHDLMHTVQAERALMQPFIADCGPWRSYFAEHDVSPAARP